MKQLLLSILFLLVPMLVSAETVEIDGIYYNLISKGKQAEVTSNINRYVGDIVIPSDFTYEGTTYSVTSIGKQAFFECYGVSSLTLPNSINSIGKSAFAYCNALDTVVIPKNVTVIEDMAFASCEGLRRVVIPEGVTKIANSAFNCCHSLDSLFLPNTVSSIEDWAFAGCESLVYIEISQSLREVGQGAFGSCSALTSVNITDLSSWCKINFTNYSATPLYYAHQLKLNGEIITDLVIPDDVNSIGTLAFGYCSNLSSITIPNSVTSIGASAFRNCSSIKTITIPNGVTSISGSTFSDCSNLTSVVIPNNVTAIGDWAFYRCPSLTSIVLPNSVVSIGKRAFDTCKKLASATIGRSVRTINEKAFANCTDLADIYCNANQVPSTSSDAFEDSYINLATLHVPDALLSSYRNTAPWSSFGTVVGDGGGGNVPKCALPTISVENGKVKFSCETEGVTYHYNIVSLGSVSGEGNDVELKNSYSVTVYATKEDYINSDSATAEIKSVGGLKGDVNGDNKVDVADHVELSKIILEQGE